MKRELHALAEKQYDLVVVGGGIFGICAAWEAALRGLSVALIERGDFSHAASGNCFKMVHGGIRYLQHGDLPRIRESSQERNILLRMAPHLVHPLPIVVPTYGHGLQGKELLCAGLSAYGLITFDRNRGISDPVKRVPLGRLMSRAECLKQFPGLKSDGLTGAVVIYDGQMYSPSRLALSFLRSAAEAGAVAANYIEATSFLRSKSGEVFGVAAKDLLTKAHFSIRGKVVLNATGAWAERLLSKSINVSLHPEATYSRDFCFVVPRRLTDNSALAVQAMTRDPDAILSRKQRHLFLVPWRNCTLVGVWHMVYGGPPDSCAVSEEELVNYIDEINDAYPPLAIKRQDISMSNFGLVLFGQNRPGSSNLSFGKRSRIIDHAEENGIKGLITLLGVRYTTARREARRAVDLVIRKVGQKMRPALSSIVPVFGGEIGDFDDFMRRGLESCPSELKMDTKRALLRNYGSRFPDILRYAKEYPNWVETLGASTIIKAEVVHAVREEMAQKLEDVVLRRTELGTAGHPGSVALTECAELMGAEMAWSKTRTQEEVQQMLRFFSARGATNGAAGQFEQGTRP